MPTEDSVRRIIRDFKPGRQSTYAAAHLFFLAGNVSSSYSLLLSIVGVLLRAVPIEKNKMPVLIDPFVNVAVIT
jgi:hypothetical protein